MAPKEENPSEAFKNAMAAFYEAKDRCDKIKMQCWNSIPEDPPNKYPKKPREKPWWDKEEEEQWAKLGLPIDLEHGVDNLSALLSGQNLSEEREAKGASKEGNTDRKDGKKKNKEEKEEGNVQVEPEDEEEEGIDVDRLLAMWTGQDGLVVPPGLRFGK
ncbi:MAG: hypothetical protein Q9163_003615 [Psora crenata]